jgi:nicotinic acid mononucleotide adenylyltransferase
VPRPLAVLPGSFNPLHHGHTSLAAAAAARLGVAVEFEPSIATVDKPSLDPEELDRRVGPVRGARSTVADQSRPGA